MPIILTKAQIGESAANANGFPKIIAYDTIETLIEIIKRSLESDEDFLISGFGKFCVREKKERLGRNPATSKDMMLRPRRVVTFKISGKLRNQINA